ncbi:MAG TPA: MFS transporter [Acidimicrobiales bacterium]|nr:MFS transporter [Acidimicrobiales bacterium]
MAVDEPTRPGPSPTTERRRAGWASLRPLRHRSFALVWAAALVSNVGTWMETVAVGDLVAVRTGEAGWTAFVAAAAFLPMGLMGPIGGAIADRVDRRQFVFVTTSLHALCAATLTGLSATGRASPGAVAAVVFVAGCVSGIGFPAYTAMLPDLVPREDLLGAVSLGQAQYNLGRVVGPALAGIAIALGSYTAAFALNTLSFGAMLAALAALRLPHRPTPADEGSLWARIRVGARAARREPGVRAAILLISVVALTASPFIALLPAMARVRHDGGPGLTSVFVTAQGVGAVVGALAVPALAERVGRHRLLMAGFVALPVALALYGVAPSPGWATLALVGVGATYIAVFSGIGTVVQLRAPAHLRARVVSLYFLALGALYPLGATVQGPIADRVGLGPVTVGAAFALLGVVALLRSVRPDTLRALDDVDAYPGPLDEPVVAPATSNPGAPGWARMAECSTTSRSSAPTCPPAPPSTTPCSPRSGARA